MRGVEFLQTSDEVLTIRRRRTPRAAVGPLVALAAWLFVAVMIGPGSLYGMIVLALGSGALPWLLPKLSTALRILGVTLSHNQGQVWVDQERIEAARVETRVVSTFFTRDLKGYSLSLWVVYSEGGSRDVELGRFKTLVEASHASWTIEAFLEKDLKIQPARVR